MGRYSVSVSFVPCPQAKGDPDEEEQRKLVVSGSSGVRVEPQLDGPVTITHSRHTKDDLLAEADILNLSKKTVAAVRFGWDIKRSGEATETKLGEWVHLQNGLKPKKTTISAQKVDFSPMLRPGTMVVLYIPRVRFEDGTIWQIDASKPEGTPNSLT
jgi:hypothetical protein